MIDSDKEGDVKKCWDNDLMESLCKGEENIAVFVVDDKHYYVIDNKENYCIDVREQYGFYAENGLIAASELQSSISSFRNGVPVLNEDSFWDYIKNNDIKLYDIDWLKEFFIDGKSDHELKVAYREIEEFLAYSHGEIRSSWELIRAKLPSFYINFKKKMFHHTDWDRSYEDSVPDDWDVRASSDFGLLIPDAEQYWNVNNMNFWKLNV